MKHVGDHQQSAYQIPMIFYASQKSFVCPFINVSSESSTFQYNTFFLHSENFLDKDRFFESSQQSYIMTLNIFGYIRDYIIFSNDITRKSKFSCFAQTCVSDIYSCSICEDTLMLNYLI